ncbi:RibD family protein, partial [Candidatus Pelagibacter sp.]|nr:RibD family protein [Candidatus Pelagibacter sp.]
LPYFFNRKKKLPFVTGKIAISKNNIIYSKNQKKITNSYSHQFTHMLRYQNDSLMITHKTLNKDNPKLNCRLKGFEKFSPKRIILDNKLNSKINSYIIKTSNNKNTLIFYNKAAKSKISKFKRKGIHLIKSRIDRNNRFDIKLILKKLHDYGCRNLLIEGGDKLTNSLIKNRIFNKFYLYKSPKKLSKNFEYLKFSSQNILNQKYKTKINLNLNLRKDRITLYS